MLTLAMLNDYATLQQRARSPYSFSMYVLQVDNRKTDTTPFGLFCARLSDERSTGFDVDMPRISNRINLDFEAAPPCM